jgi:UDP:flavonoid glycosyltransferase YjiC (YdhE family)
MTTIVIGLGSAGDVHPNAGLALGLRRRGHRVLFVAGSIFRPLAERAGLEFIGLGTDEEYYEAVRDPDMWNPYRAFYVVARRLILPMMRPIYEIIAEHNQRGPTVVAAPGTAFGARMAQEKLGVPLATVHLQPILLRSTLEPGCFGFPDIIGHLPRPLRKLYLGAVDRFLIDRELAAETNSFRAELGLPPVSRFFDRWFHSPQLIIGLFPQWFAPPPPDWPPGVRLTGFPLWDESDLRRLPPELETYLQAGEPPVIFTAGSAMAQGKDFFRVSSEVCRRSGRRGLLLTQFPDQLPPRLPDGVRHFDYVPFSAVLPRAAAFVHHGGIGTTAQALAAGVRQLVVPLAHDQPDNAVRVSRLGVGDFLLPKAYKTPTVLKRLNRLLQSSEVAEACRRRAGDVAAGTGLESACDLIEELSASAVPALDRR